MIQKTEQSKDNKISFIITRFVLADRFSLMFFCCCPQNCCWKNVKSEMQFDSWLTRVYSFHTLCYITLEYHFKHCKDAFFQYLSYFVVLISRLNQLVLQCYSCQYISLADYSASLMVAEIWMFVLMRQITMFIYDPILFSAHATYGTIRRKLYQLINTL